MAAILSMALSSYSAVCKVWGGVSLVVSRIRLLMWFSIRCTLSRQSLLKKTWRNLEFVKRVSECGK